MTKKLECYKCGSKQSLAVEEKKCNETGVILEKNFICAPCANLFQFDNFAHLTSFNIPIELKHDHTPEAVEKLQQGIDVIDKILYMGAHELCVKHVVKYAELNIKFLFLSHLTSTHACATALELFLTNIRELFSPKEVH